MSDVRIVATDLASANAVIADLQAEVERLRDELADALSAEEFAGGEAGRLRGLAMEAVKAARLFNRDGMTWMEYDRLLARIEREASDITAPRSQ